LAPDPRRVPAEFAHIDNRGLIRISAGIGVTGDPRGARDIVRFFSPPQTRTPATIAQAVTTHAITPWMRVGFCRAPTLQDSAR